MEKEEEAPIRLSGNCKSDVRFSLLRRVMPVCRGGSAQRLRQADGSVPFLDEIPANSLSARRWQTHNVGSVPIATHVVATFTGQARSGALLDASATHVTPHSGPFSISG
ncbi:hypothetical protein [Xanthomonas axonopodis]|uniref:hypothetical protein n=1 Tax=Xanthomonas axonopodis TaxID=53413 RepID=UPI0013DDBEA5|nr:hypothetical protein [Xanthomonas axonopodis]